MHRCFLTCISPLSLQTRYNLAPLSLTSARQTPSAQAVTPFTTGMESSRRQNSDGKDPRKQNFWTERDMPSQVRACPDLNEERSWIYFCKVTCSKCRRRLHTKQYVQDGKVFVITGGTSGRMLERMLTILSLTIIPYTIGLQEDKRLCLIEFALLSFLP